MPRWARSTRRSPSATVRCAIVLRADRPVPDFMEPGTSRPKASTRSRSSRRARARGSSRSFWEWPRRRSINVSLEQAEPSSSVATQGDPIEIRGRIRSQATKPVTRVVEFEVDGKKKDEKTLEIPPGGEVEVNFTALPRADETSLHQGKIKLSGAPDPSRRTTSGFSHSGSGRRSRCCWSTTSPTRPSSSRPRSTRTRTRRCARPVQVETVRATELGTKFGGNLQRFATIFLLNVDQARRAGLECAATSTCTKGAGWWSRRGT